MKYYTDIVPLDIAEKLKEKGMHQLTDARMEGWLNSGDNITYGEVFDWLMEKSVLITPDITDKDDGTLGYVAEVILIRKSSSFLGVYSTWHGAAEAAIEKALTLI